MAGDHGKGGSSIDPRLKKVAYWTAAVAIGLLFVGPILFGAATSWICTLSEGSAAYACRMEAKFAKKSAPVSEQDSPGNFQRGAVIAPPPAHQYGGRREHHAAPPRIQPARKRLVNGPRERGSAHEFCFSKFPHWRKLMAERDDCDMSFGHGSGGTKCHIACGKQ